MPVFRFKAAVLALIALSLGCVEVNRGAIVQINLKNITPSADGEHYQLFAVVKGSAVPVARFKVLRAIEDCMQDPDLVPRLTLVQAYDNGVSRREVCVQSRRLGAVDEINLAAGLLVGGVRIDTATDLGDAESMFVSIEVDGDVDPRPDLVVMRADLGAGRSPHEAILKTCLEEFCAEVPDEPTCANIPALDRARRGVLVGTFVRTPVSDVCNAVVTGDIAVVPSVDDTTF
ncbi:MAG: hypothetical protein ACI9U2_005278 [Bradymonadia bacterium]|jgi:hypothetical protein